MTIPYQRPDVLKTQTYKAEFYCNDKLQEGERGELYSFYLRLSDTDDNQLIECRITVGKAGCCTDCVMTTVTRLLSLALQYGVPPEDLVMAMIDVQCPAATAGYPMSCIDWIAKTIKKHEEAKNDGKNDI